NLDSLFSHFCKTIPEHKTSIQELVIPTNTLDINDIREAFPEYILLGAQGLTTAKLPILFCGASESFVQLITAVWAGLPRSFRIKISYTAGFSTANLDMSKTFIHFQGDLEESLRNSEH